MKYYFSFWIAAISVINMSVAQELTGAQLLDKAIEYHDPHQIWPTFNGTLDITMATPNTANRNSKIIINLPAEYFKVTAVRDSVQTMYEINKGVCRTSITDSIAGKRTPCESATLYKNYYTYLYGLPMKLKDAGTHISETTERKRFKGKEYLVLKATYDAAVGSDVWFFYFDPDTFAMEIYQFFKGDPEVEGKDTGEYILLTQEATVHGIKIPKVRNWFYNKDDGFLGTDLLNE
jgi:hypothetical protein